MMQWLANELTLDLYVCPSTFAPTNPGSPLNLTPPLPPPPVGELGPVLLVALWSWGGWNPTKLSLILQRKSDGFIHAEPFLTLPKFPDYFPLTFAICKMG